MHQIRQSIIELNCYSESFGKEMNADLSYVFEKEFYPRLENILNEYSEDNYIWLIENLEIEISEISEKYWKEEIVNKSLEQIETFLRLIKRENYQATNSDGKSNSEKLSVGNHAENLFLEFLKTGRIIENSLFSDLKLMVAEIKISEIFYLKILEVFKNQNHTILRWIFTIPEDFRNQVYQIINFQINFFGFGNLFKNSNVDEVKSFSELLMLISLNDIIKNENVFDFLNNSAKKYWNLDKTEITEFLNSKQNLDGKQLNFIDNCKENLNSEQKNIETKESKTQQEQFIYIENAGLTILHPFFTSLFEHLNLLYNNEWKSETASHRAVLLMHYLVFGCEVFQENKLILNKMLCGLPLDEVININVLLSDDEKETCEDLLKTVIEYWKILKNTSNEAFRETFLRRNGKLEFKTENTELWIEGKGVDILLDQIPWGISIIKTPWMEQILLSNWNH